MVFLVASNRHYRLLIAGIPKPMLIIRRAGSVAISRQWWDSCDETNVTTARSLQYGRVDQPLDTDTSNGSALEKGLTGRKMPTPAGRDVFIASTRQPIAALRRGTTWC